MTDRRENAGRGRRPASQQQRYFGPLDPFCGFAVVPLLIVAGVAIWGDIVIVGIVLIVLSLLILLFDSWSNRPLKRQEPRRQDDYY